jgi:hypothetical protein
MFLIEEWKWISLLVEMSAHFSLFLVLVCKLQWILFFGGSKCGTEDYESHPVQW